MSNKVVIDRNQSKSKITLSKRIAGGGAGDIYKISNKKNEVAKIYKDKMPTSTLKNYENKIRFMIQNPPDIEPIIDPTSNKKIHVTAWPTGVIEVSNKFLGFTMPEINLNQSSTLQSFLQKSTRRIKGLNQSLIHRVHIARNLCFLINELNKKNYFLIDLKPQNLQVYSETGYTILLDCDGICIAHKNNFFPGDQITIEYTPKENLDIMANQFNKMQIIQQERFALSVSLFKLLNNGIHPFSFKPKSQKYAQSAEDNIREERYVYNNENNKFGEPSPLSIHNSFSDNMLNYFHKAFSSFDRPSAKEWLEELEKFTNKKNIQSFRCSKNDNHFNFGKGCGDCNLSRISFPTNPGLNNTTSNFKISVINPIGNNYISNLFPKYLTDLRIIFILLIINIYLFSFRENNDENTKNLIIDETRKINNVNDNKTVKKPLNLKSISKKSEPESIINKTPPNNSNAPLNTLVKNSNIQDKTKVINKEENKNNLVQNQNNKKIITEKSKPSEHKQKFEKYGNPKWSNIYDYKKRLVKVQGNKFSNITECYISGNYKSNFKIILYKTIYKDEKYFLLFPLSKSGNQRDIVIDFIKFDDDKFNKSYNFKFLNNKFYSTQLSKNLIEKLQLHNYLYLNFQNKNIQLSLNGFKQAYLNIKNNCKRIN